MIKNLRNETQRIFSDAPWEKKVGYCRVIRKGPFIWVSGTAPIDERGGVFAPGDAYAQTKRCIEIIHNALNEVGANLSDITRTRMFVTDVSKWAEYGKAHAEAFASFPPATSMLEVKALIDPRMLIEIEAEAFIELQ